MDKFYRYLDVDGDGIPYRTLPGEHPKGAYFTRGSGHTKYGAYTEDAHEYPGGCRSDCWSSGRTARTLVPEAEIEYSKFNKAAILTIGSCDGAVREAMVKLNDQNVGLNYWPRQGVPVH